MLPTMTTTSQTVTAIDLGNNESMSAGRERDGAGWRAWTWRESAAFKTERGAVAWLARRGFRADGSKVIVDRVERCR